MTPDRMPSTDGGGMTAVAPRGARGEAPVSKTSHAEGEKGPARRQADGSMTARDVAAPGAKGARAAGVRIADTPTKAGGQRPAAAAKAGTPEGAAGTDGNATGEGQTAETLIVSTSPHEKDRTSVEGMMYLVILALMFPTVGAIHYFGVYAGLMIVTSVLTCILVEYVSKMLRKRPFVMDGSAVVTGLLLALVLPPRLPLWAVAIGAAVAIAIAKEAFGGLGYNIFNPALVGRAFLTVSFAGLMTEWVLPVDSPTSDAVAGATPLGEGFVREGSKGALYWDMFVGNTGGSLGETSAMLILMGGLLLVALRVINWRIPLFFIGTVTALMFALGEDVVFHVLAGGLMLGAFFMATDYVTTPLTDRGKVIFATSAGALVVAIRMWGSLPEGVAFSILIMNGFTPLIDRYTVPRPYGYVRPKKKEEVKA